MEFSPQQELALDKVAAWLNSDEQVFRLFGYAGTGKTTLARHLHADVYAAYTGKASHVLRQKGCPAQTIHSLIYLPREKSTERLRELLDLQAKEPDNADLGVRIEEERANLRRPSFTLNLDSELRFADLLVIDECSMVNEEMAKDLLSFGCKVLVLGDPAQLPPVRGGGYFTERKPDVLLTEIHRQARGNPILDLATRVRTGEDWTNHQLVTREKITPQEALAADQIIVGRNATRRSINRRMRTLLGYPDDRPVDGDKVVCTRNNHDIGIMNGATYHISDVTLGVDGKVTMVLDERICVTAHLEPFLDREVDFWRARDAETFEYGYALTCHKSQGSQWNDVIVFDESSAFPGSQNRWLYTAVTRAAESLKVVA